MDIGRKLSVRTRDAWRRWLARHHASEKEIWVVYYKKASGKSGISYEESVLEALAYGWIDGLTKSIDDATYACRFTPRRPGSNWSASNIERIQRLVRENRMAPSGLAAVPPGLTAGRARVGNVSLPLPGRAREGVRRRPRAKA